MTAIEEIAARYLTIWHEPDAAARETAVAGLWSTDARMCTGANDYIGRDAITRRITLAHDKFVAEQGCVFRPLGTAGTHHDGIRLHWEMLPAAGGDAVSAGTQFLLLDADGHIRFDYQFIDF